jgi:hypothetical protein
MQLAFRALFALGRGACLLGIPTASFADENCQRLEALAQQYAGGVELTTYERQIKARMVVWYGRNCRGGHHSAQN